jgi:ABC-type sugar transport system ATPase subunit
VVGSPRINLLSARVAADGTVRIGGLLVGQGFSEQRLGEPGTIVSVGLRPEHIRLGAPAANKLCGEIHRTEFHGAEALAVIRPEDGLPDVLVRIEPETAACLRPGDPVGLVPSAPPHLFGPDGKRIHDAVVSAMEPAHA